MSSGDDRDLVPLGTGFDIVKRGYSRTQVEEHLERLDGDLRLLAADRDAAVSQASDLARRLEQSRLDIDGLRGQIDRLSLPPTTLEGLSERLQRMLRLAQEEAGETRARAEAEAGHIRARAEMDATALKARYEQLIVDMDNRRKELEAEHKEVFRAAYAEAEKITRQAEKDRAEADAEAERRRTQVDEDLEIAMASRRTESMRTLAEQEAASKAESERRVREATQEAARIREEIAEERKTSAAEAERRLQEANKEAERLAEEAATASEARLNEATEEAHRRVREATEEANRRINHAAARVTALRELRTRVAEQLYSARNLLIEAAPTVDPLSEEEEGNVSPADGPVHDRDDSAESPTQFIELPDDFDSDDFDPDEDTTDEARPVRDDDTRPTIDVKAAERSAARSSSSRP
ncbi:MAG: chromosome segregation protein [Sciscionella sp.]